MQPAQPTIHLTNLKKGELQQETDYLSKNLTIDIFLCLTFALVFRIYLEEEDQHELYFLKKRLNESGINNQVLGERLLELAENINVFSSVNEKKIEK